MKRPIDQALSFVSQDTIAALNEMVADGTWEKLVTKYTEGTGYHYNTETNPPSPSASCA